MKKILSATLGLMLSAACAQSQTQTLFLKPGPAAGQDALIMNTDGCVLNGQSLPTENLNFGTNLETAIFDWTFNALGCQNGTGRSLIRFTGLNAIPSGATILGAELKLYGVPTSANSQGNSNYPGSPYPLTNPGWVRRVTSGWNENTVTWNTQPSTTTTNQAALPVTGNQWNWNASIDVTNMVNDMVSSGSNQGFEILLQTEEHYRSQFYASSDHPDGDRWPELVVKYTYCNAGFTFCSSDSDPYTYTFNPATTTAAYTEWSIDGNTVYGGPLAPFDWGFPGPGTYKVCLTVLEKGQEEKCTKCIALCIADNGKPGKSLDDAAKQSQNAQPAVPFLGELHLDGNFLRMQDVSPNPTKTGWNANVISAGAAEADVALYDITGKLITRYPVKLSSGANSIQVDAQKLPVGSYLLKVTAPGTPNLQTTVVKY